MGEAVIEREIIFFNINVKNIRFFKCEVPRDSDVLSACSKAYFQEQNDTKSSSKNLVESCVVDQCPLNILVSISLFLPSSKMCSTLGLC